MVQLTRGRKRQARGDDLALAFGRTIQGIGRPSVRGGAVRLERMSLPFRSGALPPGGYGEPIVTPATLQRRCAGTTADGTSSMGLV
jgi:hypothetical protein